MSTSNPGTLVRGGPGDYAPLTTGRGRIARAPASATDSLIVVLPGLSMAFPYTVPAAQWQHAANLPAANADCLVVFDDKGDAWVPEWEGMQTATTSGGAGDMHFVYTQLSASPVWNVAHNLGKFPSVSVVDTGDNELLVDVDYVDNNNLTITLGAATSGKAYLN